MRIPIAIGYLEVLKFVHPDKVTFVKIDFYNENEIQEVSVIYKLNSQKSYTIAWATTNDFEFIKDLYVLFEDHLKSKSISITEVYDYNENGLKRYFQEQKKLVMNPIRTK